LFSDYRRPPVRSGRSKLSEEASEGFLKATRTIICPGCSKIRSRENIHTFKPRIKCKHCHEKSEAFKRARRGV
jgi:ribosomal protein S27E